MKKAKKYEFTIHLLESYIAWNEDKPKEQLKDIEESMKLLSGNVMNEQRKEVDRIISKTYCKMCRDCYETAEGCSVINFADCKQVAKLKDDVHSEIERAEKRERILTIENIKGLFYEKAKMIVDKLSVVLGGEPDKFEIYKKDINKIWEQALAEMEKDEK